MVSLFRRNRRSNEKQEESQPPQKGSGTASRGPEKDSPRKDKVANGYASTDDASQNKGSAETTTFRVKIPPNVKPGKEFYVYAGTRKVKLVCPKGVKPGQSLAVTLPKEKQDENQYNGPNGPNVKLVPDTDPPAYLVTIPPNIRGGQKFPTLINGVNMMVTSPPNAIPGMDLRIVPPPPPKPERRSKSGQKFEVIVPENVQPGESFSIMAGGIRVMVQCPNNAKGGQMVRFHLPFKGDKKPIKKLEYDVDGWARTLQVARMKFQWAKVTKKHRTHANAIQKTLHQNAYVRHLSKNGVELVPAQYELVDSQLVTEDGYEVVSCSDLIEIQTMPLNLKVEAFHAICKAIGRGSEKGNYIRIKVRRDHLLQDSMHAVMVLDSGDMRKLWRVQFVGEEGIDAGGLKREWFQLISEELFNLDTGLWMTCGENQMNMQIHPSSGILNEDHLIYFRFLGRIIGKALYDGELVTGHLVQTFYKHLLGWPVTFSDLEHLDPAYYKSIKALMDMDDIEYACLDFTISEEIMGTVETVDLIPNGVDVDVTNDNVVQYLEAVLNYRLVGRIKLQLNELLQGFLDIIPSALTTIFDYQELELILCGLPNIDLEDWMQNTEYSGLFHSTGTSEESVIWFWDVVQGMDEEKKARLLQFVTGTCGVPHKGFAILKGNDGGVRRFTIHGVKMQGYPRAHFNRIDLPIYSCKEELKEKLEVAITMISTGFDLE